MFVDVTAGVHRHWVREHAGISPAGPRKASNVPRLFAVVPSNVAVHLIACRRTVEPPDLAKLGIVTRVDFRKLHQIDVAKHIIRHVAGDIPQSAIVVKEPVPAHPCRASLNHGHCIRPRDAAEPANAPHCVNEGRPDVLQGVNVCICPDQNFIRKPSPAANSTVRL